MNQRQRIALATMLFCILLTILVLGFAIIEEIQELKSSTIILTYEEKENVVYDCSSTGFISVSPFNEATFTCEVVE